jgi:hypothetical protein
MSPNSGMNDNNNNNKNKKTKLIAILPMAGALVGAAILLSGLSLIGNDGYHSAIAQQQNITEGGGGDGGASTTDSNTSFTGGATQGGNATTTGGGANQSASELRMNLEQARTALQNNDTQTAMMFLDMALSAMGGSGTEGNITSGTTAGGGNATTTTTGGDEAVSIGGTGAADDYDETADD